MNLFISFPISAPPRQVSSGKILSKKRVSAEYYLRFGRESGLASEENLRVVERGRLVAEARQGAEQAGLLP
jgi:hypothetical protein